MSDKSNVWQHASISLIGDTGASHSLTFPLGERSQALINSLATDLRIAAKDAAAKAAEAADGMDLEVAQGWIKQAVAYNQYAEQIEAAKPVTVYSKPRG